MLFFLFQHMFANLRDRLFITDFRWCVASLDEEQKVNEFVSIAFYR